MDALNTVNEQEAREAVHAELTARGITVTKTAVDQILDVASDLSIAALASGKGVKVQGLGTLEIRQHQARAYKVPNKLVEDPANPGTFLPRTYTTHNAPAGFHIGFNSSDSLLDALNAPVSI